MFLIYFPACLYFLFLLYFVLSIFKNKNDPVKYPKQVFFIIGNEFCERFCYYGNRTILSIYLSNMLNFSENTSTIIYQTFVMLCYFFPVLGGIIADCFLGKFRTILYLSILYAIGNVVLAIASQMSLPINHTVFSLLGLFMIALGTGGIKPCVSSFGGDQFKLPEQDKQLASFFSVFYFSINAGSLISTYLTPELRVQSCFGEDTCYPIAFGVPAVLMVVSLVFFVCGKPSYKINKPAGNVMVDVSKCMARAIKQKITSKEKKEHWLDYAADKYSPQLVHDSKILMELIYLFSPTIIFWALYEQQGSRWIFQAEHMNGKIWGFTIMPDQMQVVNPILIMAFIPLFELAVYPILAKMRLIRNSMQKLFWGGMVAAIAFGMSAVVEYTVQGAYPDLPGSSEAQLRIYNSYNCSMNIEAVGNSQNYSWTVDSMSMMKYTISPVSSNESLTYSAEFSGSSCPNLSKITDGTFFVYESKAISYIADEESDGSSSFLTIVRVSDDFDDLDKSDEADPKVRILYRVTETSNFTLSGGDTNSGTFNVGSHATDVYTVTDGTYSLAVNNHILSKDLILDVGGVYSLLVDEETNVTLFTITNPNTVNILWQLPQITVISIAEIMFSITGLEFSYSQAPVSMKSVISSLWLLTDSLGNVIIIFVSAVFGNSSQDSRLTLAISPLDGDSVLPRLVLLCVLSSSGLFAKVYMLSGFAIGMVLVMLVFIALARRYTRAMKKLSSMEHCK